MVPENGGVLSKKSSNSPQKISLVTNVFLEKHRSGPTVRDKVTRGPVSIFPA